MTIEAGAHGGGVSSRGAVPASGLSSVGWLGVSYAVGPAIIFLLTMTYLFEPTFYLTWVLQGVNREYQAVEFLTFGAAFAAALLLAVWVRSAWPNAVGSERLGVVAVGVVALANFFFAGEEISWGQTYLGWETPDSYFAKETNLHNSVIPAQSLGTVFLIVVFFVLPLVWSLGQRFHWRLPAGLRVAVAEGPAIVCAACALTWQETKSLYRFLHSDYLQHATYNEFFEQINEQKELLVAVAFLLYAIFRFRYRFSARNADG